MGMQRLALVKTQAGLPGRHCGRQFKALIRAAGLTLLSLSCGVSAREAGEAPRYDHIRFDVEVSASVENDTLVATLFAQREGPTAATPSAEVNELIGWAVPLAKKRDGVQVKTLGYQTSPIYAKSRIDGWRVRQSIEIRSQDTEAVTALVGEMQARLALGSIRYELSRAAERRHLGTLTTDALAAFEARASQIATNLRRTGYRIVELNLHSRNTRPPGPAPRAAGVMMAESSQRAPPPVIEGGAREVKVTASAIIELSPAP